MIVDRKPLERIDPYTGPLDWGPDMPMMTRLGTLASMAPTCAHYRFAQKWLIIGLGELMMPEYGLDVTIRQQFY